MAADPIGAATERILVTGATGFIGSHCVEALKGMDYEIHAVAYGDVTPEISSNKVFYHNVNLFKKETVKALMSDVRPTRFLHLSWQVAPDSSASSVENYYWVQASLDLLLRFVENGGKRVVMAGSSLEYDWNHGYCTEDITPRNPSNFYGICKNALQEIVKGYSSISGISTAWARIFFLFGPNEHPRRLVPSVIRSLLRGEPALCSHGKQIRDYLYVKDVADALVRMVAGNIEGAVNVGSGEPVSLKDLISYIAEKLGRSDLVRLGAIPPKPNDTNLVVANTDRLKKEMGWSPRYSLSRGLDETIEWFRNRD